MFGVSLCPASAALSRHPLAHPCGLLTANLDGNYFRWSQRDSKRFLLQMRELMIKESRQLCQVLPPSLDALFSKCHVPKNQEVGLASQAWRHPQNQAQKDLQPTAPTRAVHSILAQGTCSLLKARCIPCVRAKLTHTHAVRCCSCCPVPPSGTEPSRKCKEK